MDVFIHFPVCTQIAVLFLPHINSFIIVHHREQLGLGVLLRDTVFHAPVEHFVALQEVDIQHPDGVGERQVGEDPHDPVRVELKEVLVGTGDQLADAPAVLVGQVSEGHAGGSVGEEGLVHVALVGVLVGDEPADAVEALGLVLAEVQDERHQGRQDGAEVHLGEVLANAKQDLLHRVEARLVQTMPGYRKQENENLRIDKVQNIKYAIK